MGISFFIDLFPGGPGSLTGLLDHLRVPFLLCHNAY